MADSPQINRSAAPSSNDGILLGPTKDLEYPIDALGEVLGEVAASLAGVVMVPRGIAAQSVLASATLAGQPLVDVARGKAFRSPISLFFLSVADSGDRKSTVDKLALLPVHEWQEARARELKAQEPHYRAGREAWEASYKALKQKHSKAVEESTGKDFEAFAKALTAMELNRPSPAPIPHILIQEPNAEGLYAHLRDGMPTAGIFTDEGIGFFGGHGMTDESRGRMLAIMSALWGGDPVTRTRANALESGQLRNRRLSAHLMLQPVVAAKVLSDPLLDGQGFLARFLICHEQSIAGSRFVDEHSLSRDIRCIPEYQRYSKRLLELLNTPISICPHTGGVLPEVREISGPALQEWVRHYNRIEAEIGPGGTFSGIARVASKAPEMAARIAATLSLFDGEPEINSDHVMRAFTLIDYYLWSAASREESVFFGRRAAMAGELLDWIKGKQGGQIASDDFKRVPRRLCHRKADDLRRTLAYLVDEGYLKVVRRGRSDRPVAWALIS
ncbi:YfjI family protein [Marinobacter sp. MBR-105]|jgi:hypothetical protein